MLFRLLWGLWGSRHARFASFLRSPATVFRYAGKLARGTEPAYAGHNPLGGWAAALMLISLVLQAGSGLFLHDDILFEAPFYGSVSDDTTRTLTALHHYNGNFLLGLIALHLVALIVHRVLGERLVGPMFTGSKTLESAPPDGPGTTAIVWRALLAAMLAAIVVVWLWRL
jgi:cytochrome b